MEYLRDKPFWDPEPVYITGLYLLENTIFAIISIGYVGQKIKIGQKKTYIKKSDTVHPIISKYFSPDELKEAIRIYNDL